jgi:hypothetical protein
VCKLWPCCVVLGVAGLKYITVAIDNLAITDNCDANPYVQVMIMMIRGGGERVMLVYSSA